MIKKHTITLALLLGAIATATAQWTTLQLPTPRTLMEGVYAKGKVYFAGGYQQIAPTFVASSVVDIYDISTGTWSSTNLSQPRINIGGTVLGDSILFVGGTTLDASGNAELSTVMDIYNQTTATWTQATLPVPMRAMSAVTIGTKAYFLKGYSEDFEHDIHVYNGADGTWTTLDISASNRRRLMTAAAVGNKLLCIGGLNESTSQEVDELNVYDTDLGTWTKLTMSSEKQGVQAVTVDNKCPHYYFPAPVGTQSIGQKSLFYSTCHGFSRKRFRKSHTCICRTPRCIATYKTTTHQSRSIAFRSHVGLDQEQQR